MNPTLDPAFITTINKCVVVITAKYIFASLPTVSRMLGKFTPRYVDLISRSRTRMITKIAMSEAGKLEEWGAGGPEYTPKARERLI